MITLGFLDLIDLQYNKKATRERNTTTHQPPKNQFQPTQKAPCTHGATTMTKD